MRQLPRTILDEAEIQNDPWTWLAKWVKKNPIIHWHVGTVEMRDAECVTLEKEGFKRKNVGVYVAAKKRPQAKIFQGVREVRFNFHKDDPAKIIMRVVMDKCWPDSFRKTFIAAASQCKAELRLAEIARGGGSISQSWRLKIRAAQKNGDRKMADHWANKVAGSILQWEHGRLWLLHDKVNGLSAPPKIREIARQKYEKFYAADVRKLGRKPADEKWEERGQSENSNWIQTGHQQRQNRRGNDNKLARCRQQRISWPLLYVRRTFGTASWLHHSASKFIER